MHRWQYLKKKRKRKEAETLEAFVWYFIAPDPSTIYQHVDRVEPDSLLFVSRLRVTHGYDILMNQLQLAPNYHLISYLHDKTLSTFKVWKKSDSKLATVDKRQIHKCTFLFILSFLCWYLPKEKNCFVTFQPKQ